MRYGAAALVVLSTTALVAADGMLPPWAKKKIPYTPDQSNGSQDSYWIGVGGEDPGTPGCHMEFVPDLQRTNLCAEWINGRQFGEKCLDGKTLVETNPHDGVCHTHTGDVGNPYEVNCDAWCQLDDADSLGRCVSAVAECGGDRGTVDSARCECYPDPDLFPDPVDLPDETTDQSLEAGGDEAGRAGWTEDTGG